MAKSNEELLNLSTGAAVSQQLKALAKPAARTKVRKEITAIEGAIWDGIGQQAEDREAAI